MLWLCSLLKTLNTLHFGKITKNTPVLRVHSYANTTDLIIGGNFLSMEYNYFKIILSRWSGQFYCKSTDEINKAINKLSIGIGLIDYYFDSNDYSNPIKLNLNMDDEFPLVSSFKKSVKLKMRRNDVKDRSNSLPFASSDQYSFFSLGTASQVLFSEQPGKQILSLHM